jgi:Mn-dependent DtxR family transcriptional regulator
MKNKVLTKGEEKFLVEFIKLSDKKGVSPTHAELAKRLRKAPGTISWYVTCLIKKGFLKRSKAKSRNLTVKY